MRQAMDPAVAEVSRCCRAETLRAPAAAPRGLHLLKSDPCALQGAAGAPEPAATAATAAPAAPAAPPPPAASQQPGQQPGQQRRTLPVLEGVNAFRGELGRKVQWVAASSLGGASKRRRSSSARRLAHSSSATESSSADWGSFSWDDIEDADAPAEPTVAAVPAAVSSSIGNSEAAVSIANPWSQAHAAQQQQKWARAGSREHRPAAQQRKRGHNCKAVYMP